MIRWGFWLYEWEDGEWIRIQFFSLVNLSYARSELRFYRNHSKRKELGKKYMLLLGRQFFPNDG